MQRGEKEGNRIERTTGKFCFKTFPHRRMDMEKSPFHFAPLFIPKISYFSKQRGGGGGNKQTK